MTTEDLIEILKRYPGMRVCVNSYECDYDDPTPQVRTLTESDHVDWTNGEYREKYDDDPDEDVFDALVLFRRPESNTDFDYSLQEDVLK